MAALFLKIANLFKKRWLYQALPGFLSNKSHHLDVVCNLPTANSSGRNDGHVVSWLVFTS